MEKDLKFNSAICTSRSQSEKLLALGLKKETADMYRPPSWGGDKIIGYYAPSVVLFNDHFVENPNDLPAWSLHRLVEIMFKGDIEGFVGYNIHANSVNIMYEYAISNIEALIKMGTFNKDYLEEKL